METRKREFYCVHCDQTLGRTAFYHHRRLYFDRRSNQWRKHRRNFEQILTSRSNCSGESAPVTPQKNSAESGDVFNLSDSDEQEEEMFHLSSGNSDEGIVDTCIY